MSASPTGQPRWLNEMEEAFRGGAPGCVLTFNIYDYVVAPGTPPCRLRDFLGEYFRRRGSELVVYFSRAAGCELWTGDADDAAVREAAQRFERASGLRLEPQRAAGADAGARRHPLDELRESLAGLTRLLQQRGASVALIIDYAHFVVPATQGMAALASPDQLLAVETLHRWGIDQVIRAAGNRVVLLADEGHVNELLVGQGSGYRPITVDLPGCEERQAFIDQLAGLARHRRGEIAALAGELPLGEAAELTTGLGLGDIERLFRTAAARGATVGRDAIRAAKAEAIRALGRDLVEVFETSSGFQAVAGLPHVVEYLGGLTQLLRMGSRTVPRAVLLAGVPGVGKTFIVKAWAHELGWNCLALRAVRSKWVGESERNLERVLNIVRSLTPCILFTDEVDAVVGKREAGGDSGVSERIFARILEFTSMEEHRGRIVWVGATNRPDLLDPAVVDRFGVVIPFLTPSPADIGPLMTVLARQLDRSLASDVRFDQLAELEPLRCTSARALLEVISMAANWTDQDAGRPDNPIDHDHLHQAVLDHLRDFDPDEHEFIALTALRLTSFASLLPWRRRHERRPGYALPAYLAAFVDPESGALDQDAVATRLRQLGQRLGQRR
jgi:hypothetical protein